MDSGICTPQELGQERIAAQGVDIPVPPVMEEIEEIVNETAERVRLAPHERVQQRTVMVDNALDFAETVEAVRAVPFERVQQRTVEQIAGAPQLVEQTVEAERLVPRERVQ